jgi:hypothetical protein
MKPSMKPSRDRERLEEEDRIAETHVESNPPLPRDPMIDPVDPIDPVNTANPTGPVRGPLESQYRDGATMPGAGIVLAVLLIVAVLGLFWLFSGPNEPTPNTVMNEQPAPVQTLPPQQPEQQPGAEQAPPATEQPAQPAPEQQQPPANDTTQP